MRDAQRVREYERFLAARQYSSVGSEDAGIASDDVVGSDPTTQEAPYIRVILGSWPRERVQLIRPLRGSDTGWTVRSVIPMYGDSGQAVTDEFERARLEREKQRRLIEAIETLGKLTEGWSGEDSVAPSEQAIKDARLFASLLPDEIPEPTVCAADDGEILIDWVIADEKAVVGLEGDGRFGYALYRGGRYEPGNQEGDLSAHDLPSDLKAYLQSIKKQ
jgi:hypothetical protein